MKFKIDNKTIGLVGGVLVILIVATIIGQLLRRRARTDDSKKTVQNLNARIRSWWVMVAVFGLAMLTGGIGRWFCSG